MTRGRAVLGGRRRGRHTSGKVPLEKTLSNRQLLSNIAHMTAVLKFRKMHLHEEAGLPAGTVTDNDELATDFRHLRSLLMTLPNSQHP